MSQLTLKRGDTFIFSVAYADADSQPLIGIAEKLKSQVRTKLDSLIDELSITESVDEAGTYIFRSDNTQNYPVEVLYCDIRLTDGGMVSSSETLKIQVTSDVTR